MPPSRKIVALIFPPNVQYSRLLIEGVIDRHAHLRQWSLLELPRWSPGVSPLPEGDFPLDGAIVWVEPRDTFVLDLVGRGIPVINCGVEWAQEPGVVRVSPHPEDINRRIVTHFLSLGLKRMVVLGHKLEMRPATRLVMQGMVDVASAEGMDAVLRDIGGEESPSISPRRLLSFADETQLIKLLDTIPKPAGIFCAGDSMGYLVCLVAKHCGWRIPEDLAIMGGGGEIIGELAQPALTSVMAPMRAVGRAAVDALCEWFDTGTPPASPIIVRGAELRERESTLGSSGRVVLAAVRRHIEEHAAEGVSMNELVAVSAMPSKKLNQEYQQAFGAKPLEDANRLRIEHARRLLTENMHSIGEVAQRCGFTSQAAFYNYFLRHTGTRPSHVGKIYEAS
jgi:LacI family transcriptional regulator